jgi:hypothetical protein
MVSSHVNLVFVAACPWLLFGRIGQPGKETRRAWCQRIAFVTKEPLG